jgi:hypothetical protein
VYAVFPLRFFSELSLVAVNRTILLLRFSAFPFAVTLINSDESRERIAMCTSGITFLPVRANSEPSPQDPAGKVRRLLAE